MRRSLALLGLLLLTTFSCWAQSSQLPSAPGRWTAAKANAWYASEPFLVGANYNPANTINELEFWQAETFDPATIDKELGWAESMGLNTMRVFLHDLPYQQDAKGFIKRIDTFLSLCQKHKIRPMLVLFDSCWDPNPKLGKQRDPQPGIHNSGWVQSPGADALTDVSQYPRLEAYVKGIVGAFKNDKRVLMWDIWNEPDNTNDNSYGDNHTIKTELPKAKKIAVIQALLPQAFGWARAAGPTQPLTSGVWQFWRNDWSTDATIPAFDKMMLENSDVITFHQYADAAALEKIIPNLKRMGRPVICTEFMARGVNSKFQTHLPIARREKVGMICWGFVAGKSQTYLPWDSWQKPYVNGNEPKVWFHEILKNDGTPYDPAEVVAIKAAMGKK
ncbi:cellulase family glycosylhydrolase [Fibrella aquatilis]|uniref:Cellulase family glycosylhydrolase n=1 Tax=Fibrella aquatilis TaxID=2817059 RepID=A0A939JV60_9BACT|nr:cellulase family glycosylhydrolase [Fibrella aquatilis]MBO0930517.1 cellulase family glycosylhydrolase [Fibrella aquatilis]